MNIIEVQGISKSYQLHKRKKGINGLLKDLIKPERYTKKAVEDISFTVKEGEFVGFIGPNGSGKSTTIKMLTGILSPTSGQITVMGKSPYPNRQQLSFETGVVFGQRTQLWWNLPLVESFELLKTIYKVSDEVYEKNIKYFDDLLNIKAHFSTPVRQLSLGQRMQCEIVAAMLHNPKIIYLDEPTIGVDIVAKEKIRNFLRQINKENGTTIILTTHDIQDIEALTDRIIIINKGSIVFNDNKDELKKYYHQGKVLIIDFQDEINIDLTTLGTLIKEEQNKKYILVNQSMNEVILKLQTIASEHQIKDISFQDAGIEETIMNIYNS